MNQPKFSKALPAIVLAAYVPLAVLITYVVRMDERRQILEDARQTAEMMIERNLALHTYFAKELKPSVFALVGGRLAEGYFDPDWMSSSHAIRTINGSLEGFRKGGFLYKECAINARSPENEADAFERAFLLRAARDPRVTEWHGIREIGGKPFFAVLMRGESMEESCLLCHSDPKAAPSGLIDRFGDQRSFGRKAGDLVSAVSVRIPLSKAYAHADRRSKHLILWLTTAVGVVLLALLLLVRSYVSRPLTRLSEALDDIGRDDTLLGRPVDPGGGDEIRRVADSFVALSGRVKRHLDDLEAEVARRTERLSTVNGELLAEIEERARVQSELTASEQRYRSLFSNMSEAFALHEVILDGEGKVADYRFVDVNPAFEAETGLPRQKVVGATQREVLPAEDPFWRETYGKVALGGEPLHLKHFSSGLRKHYEVYVYSPERMKFAVLFRDVTKQHELELGLRQAQKMEAIGTLAGGIAHDFNNILTPVMAHAELALMQLEEGDPVREDITQLLRAVERAADLVKQILAISRRETDRAALPLRLGGLVKETTKFLRASLPSSIEIRTELAPGCGAVLGDLSQLHQVLLNLCTNAGQAMGETGGVLTVALAPAEGEETGRAGRWVRLTVSDTGAGIPPEVIGRVFEPYFTTKPPGKGSGLGLSVAHGIVTRLGGEITVHSTPGEGTTFEVLLPETARPEEPEAAVAEEIPRGHGQRVLVVDDEEGIRKVLQRVLNSLGYRVTACAGGEEALAVFQEEPEAFDAVLTDHTMPRMSGLELAGQLLHVRPGLPVVLGTGFAEGVDTEAITRLGLGALVMKPYDSRKLGEVLARVLPSARRPTPEG